MPRKFLTRLLPSLVLGFLSSLLVTLPGRSAEELFLTYGSAKFSVKVSSLEAFAKDGTIDKKLAVYLQGTSPEQRAEFRQALSQRADIDPLVISRFFNSAMGEDLLRRIGKGFTIPYGINGKYALRAAIIQSALDKEEGLTLINVLKHFPTDIQIQGELLLGLSKAIERVVDATITYTKVMKELSAQEASEETEVNFAQLPNIREKGNFQYTRSQFTIKDASRDRQFYVILYKPTSARSAKIPLVVISHGLASKPEDFEDIAKHLASYGFAVALPQHPGSDFQQAKNFLEGYSGEVFDINEFVNRPKDISATIDELERRNASEFAGKLDTQNVGVIGHSFGGYTALAVAGAEIDFDYLQAECDRAYNGLNISLLLQCRALTIPRQAYQFRDPRVTAILAGNPVNSSIFGEKGLKKITIPIAFISGNYDPATPAVFEQVRSFVWLNTPNKYLLLAEGQAHVDFSELDAGITDALNVVPNLTLPEPSLLHSYRDPLILAYLEVYTAQNPKFLPYLSSAYAAYLSQNQQFNVYMISEKSEPELLEAMKKFRAKYKN